MKHIKWIALAIVAFFLTLTCTSSPAGTLSTLYTNPSQFTSLWFGAHSHWLQPWRAYLETVPATTFLNGTGLVWNVNDSVNQELVARLIAKQGIRRARIEINWSNIDFNDETKLTPHSTTRFRSQLLALKKYGIRPLILLNAFQGAPTPLKLFERTIVADADAGDTKVKLNDTSGLQVGHSGLSNLTQYWAAEALITNITGNTITLSKPLPKNIKAGTSMPMATLKYRPFSPPDTTDYKVTMAAWQRYVGTVAKFVTEVLNTQQSTDKGFDMEIWNELSFGSDFLFINSYYGQKTYNYDENSIFRNLVKETAEYVNTHPKRFQGVLFSNGLASTIPWPSSSKNPARITALSKHPYRSRSNYPKDESKGTAINALYQKSKSGFIPSYSALFPEYFATALQTETMIRDMGPMTSDVYGTAHGRNARVIKNVVVPNPVWVTEANINPLEDNPQITVPRALAVKAKITARYFCFFLNKGATQVHIYAATGGDKEWGIVKQNFINYAKQPNAVYPANDTSYTSSALATVGRIVSRMSQQVDPALTSTRPLKIVSIGDTHNHYQFVGNGTAEHPTLYNRDVFAFLPFQVNSKRFIIPYYVMTRDVMKDLPPEQFTVQIRGLKGSEASVTAYDPINDRNVPVVVKSKKQNSLELILTTTDYPYLLTIQEA